MTIGALVSRSEPFCASSLARGEGVHVASAAVPGIADGLAVSLEAFLFSLWFCGDESPRFFELDFGQTLHRVGVDDEQSE